MGTLFWIGIAIATVIVGTLIGCLVELFYTDPKFGGYLIKCLVELFYKCK